MKVNLNLNELTDVIKKIILESKNNKVFLKEERVNETGADQLLGSSFTESRQPIKIKLSELRNVIKKIIRESDELNGVGNSQLLSSYLNECEDYDFKIVEHVSNNSPGVLELIFYVSQGENDKVILEIKYYGEYSPDEPEVNYKGGTEFFIDEIKQIYPEEIIFSQSDIHGAQDVNKFIIDFIENNMPENDSFDEPDYDRHGDTKWMDYTN